MAEKREHQRVSCAEKCFLYCADSRYNGAIVNISISGALVMLPDFTEGCIMPGDTCSFLLSNDPATSCYRYKGRVMRVNPPGVGVRILEMEF